MYVLSSCLGLHHTYTLTKLHLHGVKTAMSLLLLLLLLPTSPDSPGAHPHHRHQRNLVHPCAAYSLLQSAHLWAPGSKSAIVLLLLLPLSTHPDSSPPAPLL
jgi:hypothetical protein